MVQVDVFLLLALRIFFLTSHFSMIKVLSSWESLERELMEACWFCLQLFERDVEHAFCNPCNPHLLRLQLPCAARELPLSGTISLCWKFFLLCWAHCFCYCPGLHILSFVKVALWQATVGIKCISAYKWEDNLVHTQSTAQGKPRHNNVQK